MHTNAEFHFIRTSEGLAAFEPQWRKLWQQDPNAKPFQTPDWLVPWWKQFGNDRLCSLAISRGGRHIGFLPFYVYQDAQKGQRQLLPLGVGTTDYLDGVFAPECSNEEIGQAIAQLRNETKHDVLCVSQLAAHSRLLEAFGKGRRTSGQGPDVIEREAAVFVSQSDSCSRMAAVAMLDLPQKIKRNAMYYRNRAQRCGTLELTQADESNWAEIFELLRRLHTSRWRTRGEEGVLVDERVVRWHRESIPLMLRAGLLRLMALRLNDEVIAALYSLIDRERVGRTQYFYITAYSPEHSELRPGTLLIAYAVEYAAREGVATVDMLRGDEGYKQVWHMEKAPTWCVTQLAAHAADQDRRQTAA